MLTVSASFYLENPQPRLLEIELMADKASLDDLRGLRTWSTANRLWRLDGAELLAQHGLTWSGFDVLLALLDGPRRSGQLCRELGMTTGGMAKLLKRLENSDIVERRRGEEQDLRTVTVQLTTEGQALVETAGSAVLEMRNADYRKWGISNDSLDALTAAWNHLREYGTVERPQ